VIFVTVGTNEASFDRLLNALDSLPTGTPLLVQHGPSSVRPEGADCAPYLSFDETVAAMRKARVVVTHAGVGSVLTALLNGRRPIVVPRLKRFGEAVDDHQLAFGRRFRDAALVTLVEDVAGLPEALAGHEQSPPPPPRPAEALIADLHGFLVETIGREKTDYST
jgi:beta-1,4-N-acetylglucosaminyltransferase